MAGMMVIEDKEFATEWVQPEEDKPKTESKSKKNVRREDGSYEGPFSDPVYKQIALRNGEINRMTKEQIRQKLAELKLDTRGVKEVLKKRLKNHYKRQKLMKACVKTTENAPHFKYLLVIDFEATCQEHNPSGFKYEIIEFPIVLVDTREKKVIDEFHSYVKPTLNPKLTDFCKTLTGISQELVDHAEAFPCVMGRVLQWLESHKLRKPSQFAVATDGPWDMARFMHLQCKMSRVAFPRWARKWINIRKSYSNFYGFRRSKLSVMLENMGMSFEGQQHSGIDDSRNIARIIIRMLEDGADLRINERLHQHKLNGLEELGPEILAVNEEEGDSEDSDGGRSSLTNNHHVSHVDCDVHAMAMAMGNLNIPNGPLADNAGLFYEEDGYDDLLAYYALQTT